MNNSEKAINELVSSVLAERLDSYEKQFERETELCPKMARIAMVARRPFDASEAEQEHISGCVHCGARVKAFRSELHPSLIKLITTALNLGSEAEQQSVSAHLRHGCDECNRLLNTSWIKNVMAGVKAGWMSLKNLADVMAHAHYGMSQVQVASLRYAENDQRDKPFFARLKDGDFSITLEEMDSDDLFVRVATTNLELKDQTIHLEISGERQNLEADIRLEQVNQLLEGIHLFPEFKSAKTKLGTVLILVGAKIHQP